jgi:hypothetical protein
MPADPNVPCRPLTVVPQACPAVGCDLDFDTPDSLRGTLYWSDANTWIYRAGGKPKDVSTAACRGSPCTSPCMSRPAVWASVIGEWG